MPKTAVISARIGPELKCEVEEVFKELGLTATQVITQNGFAFGFVQVALTGPAACSQ
jgi:hypothetical protein